MINIYIFASVFVVSLISLVGIIALAVKIEKLKKALMFLVSFSAGSLIGGSFLHLLPELIEEEKFNLNSSFYIIGGILLFFVLEKILHWRHCHIPTCDDHPHHLAAINLVGDGLHNLLDGIIIATAFFINPTTGIATTIAVILHEIPQEIGDFGVLIYAGLSKFKAIIYNLLSALTAILGAALAIIFQNTMENFIDIAVPLTIGGFIYIATADLIPELKKETSVISSSKQFIGIILGVSLMGLLLLME